VLSVATIGTAKRGLVEGNKYSPYSTRIPPMPP
jgi:hypothetical protein